MNVKKVGALSVPGILPRGKPKTPISASTTRFSPLSSASPTINSMESTNVESNPVSDDVVDTSTTIISGIISSGQSQSEESPDTLTDTLTHAAQCHTHTHTALTDHLSEHTARDIPDPKERAVEAAGQMLERGDISQQVQ